MKVNHIGGGLKSTPELRGGGKDFSTVLTGDPGEPDNYRMVVVRQDGSVYTPRHKHNFDQLRMCFSGKVNYGPDQWILPGQIAYFPEGVPYGPEESDTPRFGLTIQFGGASGSGYLSEDQVKRATEELKQVGTFEKGAFKRADARPGERRNQDAFEAVWEYVNGRKLAYPQPRYQAPVLMKPENFNWVEQAGAPALAVKRLGCFSERSVEISLVKLEAGGHATLAARPGRQIGFVLDGRGSIDGEALHLHSAFELDPGETAILGATAQLELLLVGLPVFARRDDAAQQEARQLAPA